MTYGYYGNKRGRKQSRSKAKQLEVRRILASLAMTAGILACPFGVSEAAIVRESGAILDASGTVHNIDPEKVVSTDFAYNRFKQFSLDAGHIANLKFSDGTTTAATLANLVNNQVTINGIVNAVKSGAIDGHLIFLSPTGIAVGSSGVINAGSFTGIVPTKDAFDKIYNTDNPTADITSEAIEKINDYADGKIKDFANGGTINISGHINTHSGVMLGAGLININDGAKIQSVGNIDFTSVVNLPEGVAGTVSAGTGGDVILTAKQTSEVKDTKTVNNAQTANPIRWKDRSTDLNAAVNIGTNTLAENETPKGVSITSSDGAVKITAESTSKYEDSTPMTLTDTLKTAIFGTEETAFDGLLDKLAKKEGDANKYLFVNYSSKKNKSSVNVGANSTITGKNIDISATSTVDIDQSAVGQSAAGKKDSNGQEVQDGSKAIVSVAVSRVYNNADVVIDGNLTAAEAGSIKIAATADTKAKLSAAGNGGDANAVAVGVAVLTGDTKSKVTVNEGATALEVEKGKVSIDATTKSDVAVTVNAVGTNSYVGSNVGVVNYDTSADVTVNRSVTAGAVDVNAKNIITGLKMTVDNKASSDEGKSAPETSQEEKDQDDTDAQKEESGKTQEEKKSEQNAISPTEVLKGANVDTNDKKTKDAAGTDGKGGVQDVIDKVEGTNTGGDNEKKTSAFGLGASVGVVSNKNDANVTIGKNAVISATPVTGGADGSVNVKANTLMIAPKDEEDSTKFKEDTLQFTVKNTQSNSANVEIGAAVLVSNVKNNATLLLDTDGTNAAQITGGAVSLDAKAGMGKYKITQPKKDENGNVIPNQTEEVEKTSTLTYTVSSEGTASDDTPSKFALEGSVGVNTLKNNAIVLLGQNSQVTGSAVKLASDATTNAEGTYGATDNNTTVGLGATVGIQNIRGNSLVMAGKGARITGTNSLEASANNEMDLKNSVQNTGKGDSIGVSGMVALSYGDSNSIVSLDDEVAINAPGTLTITSTNSTNIDNSARSESAGNAGAKAFGIGVGIVNYDVNSIAMVGDNGSELSAPSVSTTNPTDSEKAAQKIYKNATLARDVAGTTLSAKLGSKTIGNAKGSITTGALIGAAVTTGMIQNDAKAKVVPSAAENENENENERTDSERWTQWSNQGAAGAVEARTNAQNLENTQDQEQNHDVTSQNESDAPNATGAMGEASRAADPDGSNITEHEGAAPTANSAQSAGASIGIEGSVALTFLGGRTDAVLDNVTVKNGTEKAPEPVAAVSLSATDFLGSITLGGTGVKHSLTAGSAAKVGIGGTFSMNSTNRDVDSLIRNSDLPMALLVSNSATKIGIEVAAGMGTSTAEGDGANINGAGVVYYNRARQDVHALLINNNVMGASVSNQATSTDFQIAGGLSGIKGSGANTNVGFGGAVAISNLENNLSSGIIGGNYTVFSSVDVEAQKGTTQINGALAGTKGGYGFEGAFAYGSTKNNTHAYIDGATVTGITESAVNVKAGEILVDDTQFTKEKEDIVGTEEKVGKIDKSIDANPNTIDTQHNYTQLDDGKKTQLKTQLKAQANSSLDKEKKAQEDNKKTLDDMGLDTTGESYLDKRSAASSLDDDAKTTDEGKIAGDAAKDEDDAKGDLGKNHSLTITAAMGGGWNENVGAGAGIAYNYVKNDIAADIKGSTITADTISGEAASDATIVSVGAGIAVGGKTFNGAGSGSWNDLKNDTKVNFEGNTITGKSISEKAENSSSIINIAGEVAGGKGMAMGLSLAYNSLNNTTGTYLKNNALTLQSESNAPGEVVLAAANTGKALAVAGGVNVNIRQSTVGAVGTVAINRGVNHTESVIDNADNKIENVKNLSVTASDLTKKTTVAGGVSVGGKKVGVGGAVAYTSVGSSGDKERLRAEVNHANITTTDNGTITVSTADSKTTTENEETKTEKSRVITVGAGFGVSWGKNYFNLQGGAAVSDIYKDSRASLNNTNINKNTEANPNCADNHPTINVTADTKSKINTVGVGGSVDIGSQVKGAAGVAINRMDQDTKAEMATGSDTTTVNAGLTQVRATGDGDIHSVGVGGLIGVGGQVAFAGSGSYNYIGNDVDAIIQNQNLTSNGSVGVVAQSDDRLYNFAGGFAIGANTKVGLGAAVSINKITGNTNALVQSGSVAAKDGGNIAVTRPQDDKLFTTERIDLTTDRTKLSESRAAENATENKTGIVVDSSATHTVISQMSSGGVAASASVGVDLAGTVNLNTIEGSTTAKIKDADINTANNASNVNVNAVDYTNIGTFTGTITVGAAATAGVSVGVSADWETLNRTTTAEISSSGEKNNVRAKDLTVDAVAKHGSSTLSFAAAAGAAATAGVASGDSIMRHKNTSTTSALLKNTNAVFDVAANIRATHLGNSYAQNIAVTAAGGYAAVGIGAGVSVMDDASTVKAEVNSSELKAKKDEQGKNTGKNISVLATNENNWKETLVTASLAVGLGGALAANVGIHNTTGETAALVTNSKLEAADVTVNATDKLTATSIGGVGAGGLAGAGVAVALNNINNSVSAHVTGGSVTASNDIEVKAEEERSFDGQVTGAAAGGIGVGVNVAVTSINKGIKDAQLSSAKDENDNSTGVGDTTQNEINKQLNGYDTKDKSGKVVHVSGVNEAKGALGTGTTFFGLSSKDSDLNAARNTTVSLASPEYSSTTPDTRKQGVHTSVTGGASLTAEGNVNVTATDTSDVFQKNVGVTAAGAASVNVTDAIIHTNYDTDVTVNKASITGKNVNINALQTQAQPKDGKQGSDVRVTAVTVGALGGVGVGYAGIVNRGSTDIDITGSTIQATGNSDADTGVTINATDESKHKSQILSVGVAALNVTTTFASVENYSNVGITLNDMKDSENKIISTNISAAKNVNIDAKKANTLEAHTQGVGVGGVNVAVNHATIEDGGKDGNRNTGITAAKITGTNGTFSADKFHLGATNDTTARLSAGNVAVSVLGISTMRGKGVMEMGADVSVAGGAFNAKTVEFASQLGTANGRTLEGNVKGHNISLGAVAPDTVRLETTATGKVNVANSTFGEDTDLILDNESYVDRKGYIYDVTVGGVAVGNSRAIISGTETLTTTLAGKTGITNKLNSLHVGTYGENTGKALADAGGGGLVGYVGAHVDNKSMHSDETPNTVNSSLSGKWDVQGEVWLVAAHLDETRLTAKEGHGGVIGVGGTSVENKIKTTTKAKVEDDTEITADRVHVGTGNFVTTGAYDDKDGNGHTDAQTYTLQDHFGGVISGNRLRSLLDVTENGTVTIGENAKITTNNLQEFIAASENNLTNHASAKGGGAVAITDTVTENKLTINNTVNVNTGAKLSNEKAASNEDILLAAYDGHKLNSHADATVGGVAGVLVSKNETTINRTSNVNVAGDIESGSNVGLYAGANEDGVLSNLNVDLKAGVYNYTAIPVSSPTVHYNMNADRGTVDVSGTVRSTRDINAIASGGKEEVVKDETKWAWVTGGKTINKSFLTSNAVVAEEAMPKTSTVNVTGSLIAGTAAPINVTIGGSVAEGLTIEADNNQANLRVKNGITEGTFDYANTLGARYKELNELISSYDGDATKMAAYIAERDRIKKKMKDLKLLETDANGNVTAYNSSLPIYFVEIPDIATSGGNINVTANEFIGTGKLHANSAPSVKITNASDAYLKLNNIIMGEKGGQIIYNQDHIIHPPAATGNAEINAININTKEAKFSEIGGRTDDTQTAGLEVRNTKTFSGVDGKTSTVRLTDKIKTMIESDTELTAAEKEEYKTAISNGQVKYTAITDVEVNGKISNYYGNVTISNASGDIRISGGTKDRPTGVEGNSVSLIASNGTIAQDYKEGIVNIDGEPERYFEGPANSLKEGLNLSETSAASGSSNYNKPLRTVSETPTGYIAGRDVYVSAANINVNGLIQSGYKTYAATVTDEQLATAKTRPAASAAVVQNRTMYKVNEGGAQWNSTEKIFDYVPQVYWDPSTDKLVVEDIDTAGGKIYLTGMIASTGTGTYSSDNKLIPGRILAADGAAKISVKNETALDMNVGNVLNNQRQGIITIADTAKDTWTEYRSILVADAANGTKTRKWQTRTIQPGYDVNDTTKGYAAYMKEHREDGDPYASIVPATTNTPTATSLSYKVKDKQTYSWVNGSSIDTTRTYEHYERRGFWGLVQTANETQLKAWQQSSNPVSTDDKKKYGLPEGAVISQNSIIIPDENNLRVDGSTRVLEEKITDRTHDQWRSGFLGWFKHTKDRWKVGTKTIQLYNYTLDASQPITIGLIGEEIGSINIASTNDKGGSINLTGNVANSHNEATLNISSKAGGITQFDNTTLKSEIVNLTAKDDIKNIHIASIGSKDTSGNVADNIQLTAVSTGKGDIDITAVGGELENQSLPGNVEIVALKSRSRDETEDNPYVFDKNADLGDVTLTANGNITQSVTQSGNGITVEGRGINLTSKNGGIGTSNQAIQIAGSDLVYSTDRYGAQVNASAQGSIYLTEEANGGDMRVGKIESKTGDVTLTVANGGFIDGLPGDDKSGSTDSVDEMVHRWIDAGLIDGEKNANGYTYKGAYIEGLEKARDDYAANVRAAYSNKTQAQWQADYAEQKTEVEKIYASTEYSAYLANKAKYDKLSQDDRRKLADSGDSAFMAYAKSAEKYAQYSNYENAEAYLQDTAAYKYSRYADADAYLDPNNGDATYKDLKAKADNPTFEWTKDMMLYAVSDALVNKASGSSIQTKRAANVLGNNVTLTSIQGAVGTVEDVATTITAAELKADITKMKALMNVDASDVEVTWAGDNESKTLESFTIKRNLPLGVKASGILNVQAGGDVSVAGRTNTAGEHSALKVGTVDATKNSTNGDGDVRLYSAKGIYNAGIYNALDDTQTQTNIKGRNLLLVGGEEKVSVDGDAKASIGTSKKPLTVNLSGDLTEARASENVYIKNMNKDDVLRLGAMYAGNTISLNSDKGFKMRDAYNPDKNIAQSYINAGRNLEFVTKPDIEGGSIVGGIIDGEDYSIRILNDRAPVNVEAGSAYIRGMGSISQGVQNGTLLLGTINTTGEFVANSDGSLAVGREEETDSSGNVVKEAVAGSVNAGGNVTLAAADKLTLDGTVTAGNLTNAKKELSLKAVNGNITQTDKGAITADTVKTFNGKSLLLENTGNQFNSIIVDGIEPKQGEQPVAIAGDVRIKDNADTLTVAIKRDVTGDISVQNLRENGTLTNDGNLTATGKITLTSKGDLAQTADTTFTADKDVTLTSSNGFLETNGNITATAGSIALEAGSLLRQTSGTTLKAGKDVTLTSTGNGSQYSKTIQQYGKIDAGGKVTMTAVEDVGATDVTAGEDVTITAQNGNISHTGGKIDTKGSASLIAGTDVDVSALAAGGDVKLTAQTGNVSQLGEITAKGSAILYAGDDVRQQVNAILTAGKDVSITAVSGGVEQQVSDGAGIQAQKVTVASAKTVDLQGSGNQFESITVQSATANPIAGNVFVKDDADVLKLSVASPVNGNIDVENTKEKGTLQVVSELHAERASSSDKGDIKLTSDGSMQVDNKIWATNTVNLTSTDGAMNIGGDVTTEKGEITLQSKGNMQTTGKLAAGDDVNLTSDNGNVSISGDISTGTVIPTWDKEEPKIEEPYDYNALVIRAGGAIQEAAGVKIDTPVVETYSGKGVSMESKNNAFSTFLADALTEGGTIGGTVKVASNYAKAEDNDFMVGVGATILGDAEFTNLNPKGDLAILILDPSENNKEIKVLGGNGAEGNLVLNSGKDVMLLGDANAAHDIVIDAANGSFYGIGRGMEAGNDVSVTVGDGAYYVGATINAGNDINMQVSQPGSKDAGIYIGALPENIEAIGSEAVGNPTILTAGHDARFAVNGNGNIGLGGYVTAGTGEKVGDVVANISGKGSVVVTKSVESKNGSVSVKTGTGDIRIGTDNQTEDETVKAKQNVNVETDLGTVYILGKTSTDPNTGGDITMKAGQNTYEEGADHGNFIIRDDGKLISGGGVTLNGRNGDIHITDDIQAAKGITATITEKGNVYFDRDVTVTNDVNITTDDGDIEVGHTVDAEKGTVNLQTGSGNILVGQDITAGKDVSISAHEGNVVVGDVETGNDGDVLSKTGNVSIRTDSGNVGIVKTVTAQEGSIDIAVTSGEGSILIGNNGPSVLTVHAKQNIELTTQDGIIEVYGKTKTDKGDITVAARDKENNNNLLIKNDGISFNGELDAASDSADPDATGNLKLQTYNGDIEITDNTKAKGDIYAKVENKGDITFGVDVSSDGNLTFEVGDGDIIVGKDVKAAGDIAMTAGTGSIIVGANADSENSNEGTVTSEKGNVNISTGQGLVAINKSVTAQQGSIDIQVGTGGVTIGNNGPGVETVTAYKNIDIDVELGRIEIYGKTSTKTGDISMSAAENQYIPGGQNIIIAQNGELDSAQDARLTGRNGDLHVTDAVKATRNLEVTVHDEGDIALDRNVNVLGNTTITNTGRGSVYGHDIVSGGTTHVSLTNGDLFLNLAEGKAVVLRMENNTAASRVNKVLADANGGAGPDVELTGNYIPIGTLTARNGTPVFEVTAIGAGNQKLIGGEISVDSLRSKNGTHMPSLWANRGSIHVDEGDLAIDDVLAVDKIHLENDLTDVAIYGRTPTRDGEQLVYWNNLGMANSKQRSFLLYTDGTLRTHGAILIDAERNYGKLYGDNLSVVDMMRERLTHEHGQYTFDSTLLTKPGEALRENMLFGMEAVDAGIRQYNATNEELW